MSLLTSLCTRCYDPEGVGCYFVNRLITHGRVTPHREGPAHRVASLQKSDGKRIAIKNERQTMHLLLSPVLANVYYVGGGSLGLVLLIVVIVLVLRR